MRYTRHELKQDKFVESAAEVVHEVAEHRTGVIRIAIVAVVAALLLGSLAWYMNSREELAADAMGQALQTLNTAVVPAGTPAPESTPVFHSDQERLIAAKNAFYLVSGQYGWTSSGRYARYMAAVTEQQLGKDDVAEDQLRAISHGRHRELAALAKFALASVYRDEKRDPDAINLLQTLIDNPTSSVPKASAQMALADVYLSEHQPDKAKVILDQVAKENPKNALSEMAKTRKSDLK